MTPEHPSPNDLLDLHFGEARGSRRARLAGHAALCAGCGSTLANLEWFQRSLAALPEEEPPEDGLARVLARIGSARPASRGRPAWTAPVAACLAGVAAGAGTIYAAGARLLAEPFVIELPLLAPVKALSGFGLAALVFFGIGSLVTLALAPVLLIESQSQARSLATR